MWLGDRDMSLPMILIHSQGELIGDQGKVDYLPLFQRNFKKIHEVANIFETYIINVTVL